FNFPSIGCIPCTSAVSTSGDSREGRWSNSNKTECGLHTTEKP
ncbi:MAG: phosphoadenosine phosphosulfate reductase, partial [Lactobacillus sp.]|nr:phosphoadenosine phosphosulfate reductase [Lactobacillus sp.]